MAVKGRRCENGHKYRRYEIELQHSRYFPSTRGHPARKELTTHTGRSIWKCMDCPHYLYDPQKVVGRDARCFDCDEPFIVKPQHLRLSGYESTGLTGIEGWRAKILCGENCQENIKKRAGISGETTLDQLLKNTITDAADAAPSSDSEQEKGVLASLVEQMHRED